jgi:hypothetical protein
MAGEIISSKSYSAEQVAEGLAVLAAHAGNAKTAEREVGVPQSTLRSWRERFPKRYEEAANKIARQVEQVIARQAREVASRASDVELLGLQRAHERLVADTDKQPAVTAYRASILKGINVDKSLLISGKPTQIVASLDQAQEDLAWLRARALPVEAEVVEETTEPEVVQSDAEQEPPTASAL